MQPYQSLCYYREAMGLNSYIMLEDHYETIDLISDGLTQEAITEKVELEAALFNIIN